MQCDRIPDELQTVFVPVACFFPEKIARSVRTVYLEPLLRGRQVASLVPPQIMQDGSYGVGLAITALELGSLVGDDGAEEPAPHAVIVSEVIEMLVAQKKSFGYQWSVGDSDSGENSSWES